MCGLVSRTTNQGADDRLISLIDVGDTIVHRMALWALKHITWHEQWLLATSKGGPHTYVRVVVGHASPPQLLRALSRVRPHEITDCGCGASGLSRQDNTCEHSRRRTILCTLLRCAPIGTFFAVALTKTRWMVLLYRTQGKHWPTADHCLSALC